jgi:protein-S-isoprenylcysteine O-methyltransferase Ste14
MQQLIRQQVAQGIAFFMLFALALFLPAGTLAWPEGWTFLILFFGFYTLINAWLARHNPALLEERLRLRTADQQGWDKLLFPVLLLVSIGWLGLLALDGARAHWSYVPIWLQGVGGIVLVGSFALLFLTFRENSYLSPVVRIQRERGHSVISTGPYRYVRHPMYAAIVVFVVGTSLLLGSWFGMLAGGLFLGLLARRALLEEQALRANLPGYEAYIARVRYRLIPYVW